MERNVAKHVLADVFLITHGAKGEQETRVMYELLRRSYRLRQMVWHEECLQAAWEQYKYWLHSNSSFKIPVRSKPKSRLRKKYTEPFYPIRLEKRGRLEWEFAWPSEVLNLTSKLNLGCEYLENDDTNKAKRIFNSIIQECPYFIDVHNHLAMIEWDAGNIIRAESHYSQAYEIGRSVLSADFRGKLPWGWVENRPFLRAIHGLALVKLRQDDIKNAQKLLDWLIKLEPEDFLGVRSIIKDIKKGIVPWNE
ncbi:tetratricopeptide repeat protein [Desulfoscipio sp. XC116]|uniref:tetratricopeptide repeat protein n=1 Tax=Desulfoscipio sp. XC116 TaxID=3144975 RepID=UPI00325AC4B1